MLFQIASENHHTSPLHLILNFFSTMVGSYLKNKYPIDHRISEVFLQKYEGQKKMNLDEQNYVTAG